MPWGSADGTKRGATMRVCPSSIVFRRGEYRRVSAVGAVGEPVAGCTPVLRTVA